MPFDDVADLGAPGPPDHLAAADDAIGVHLEGDALAPHPQRGPVVHGAALSCCRRHSRAIQSDCRSVKRTPPAMDEPRGHRQPQRARRWSGAARTAALADAARRGWRTCGRRRRPRARPAGIAWPAPTTAGATAWGHRTKSGQPRPRQRSAYCRPLNDLRPHAAACEIWEQSFRNARLFIRAAQLSTHSMQVITCYQPGGTATVEASWTCAKLCSRPPSRSSPKPACAAPPPAGSPRRPASTRSPSSATSGPRTSSSRPPSSTSPARRPSASCRPTPSTREAELIDWCRAHHRDLHRMRALIRKTMGELRRASRSTARTACRPRCASRRNWPTTSAA